jgi:hypothetical protein
VASSREQPYDGGWTGGHDHSGPPGDCARRSVIDGNPTRSASDASDYSMSFRWPARRA